MKRALLVVVFCVLVLASVALFLLERARNAAVMGAFAESGMLARKPAIAEAARLAPASDIGVEIFAAAAGREWLARHPGDPASAQVRERLTGRLPWGYPHPWRWPNGDYASEFLAAKAEMEMAAPAPEGSDGDLDPARALLLDAAAARPSWRQHRRTLEALALAVQR